MIKHEHAEVIKAWADGATIEWRCRPSEYRVKPTPTKWQAEKDAQTAGKMCQARFFPKFTPNDNWSDGLWDFNSDILEYRIMPEYKTFDEVKYVLLSEGKIAFNPSGRAPIVYTFGAKVAIRYLFEPRWSIE
jgi:hypothetical protein